MQGLKSFTRLIVVDSQHCGGGGVIVAGVARELRRKPRKHCCCYYQSRCQSVTDCHGSSIAGTHAVCARAPAQDSLACSRTRQCWLQLRVSCPATVQRVRGAGRLQVSRLESPVQSSANAACRRRRFRCADRFCAGAAPIYFRYATPRGRAEMARSDACHATCHVVPTAGT